MFSLSKSAYDFLELPVFFNDQKEKENNKENKQKKLRTRKDKSWIKDKL